MPRRKITATIDAKTAAELPELTANQARFVERLLAGDNASDAYRAAYDASNCVPNTIWAAASKLSADTKVRQWLAAARKACLGSAVVTIDNHTQQLERLREIALDTGNVGAAVQAEQYRGKVAGLYVEQYRNLTPRDPSDILKDLQSFSPRVAAVVAEELAGAGSAPMIEHKADELVEVTSEG